MMRKFTHYLLTHGLIALLTLMVGTSAFAQVTTSAISGVVKDDKGSALPGATVVAIHVPSGTKYGTVTNGDGRYTFPAVRVGGPYKVTATFVGYKDQIVEGITANLGTAANVNLNMKDDSKELNEVIVKSGRSDIFSSERTGAATTYGVATINRLPTLSRSMNDITKYNAYSGSGGSFAGQDSRFNNITIDGSVFNNSFGLGGDAMAGTRAGSALIKTTALSLDAVEQIQVNIAPFDIRQSGFGGAGINAVTRSGTNELQGSVYGFTQNNGLVGKTANGIAIPAPTFDQKSYGMRLGGALIKNKLFFFVNGEVLQGSAPALSWLAARPGETGNVSRTTADDLTGLATFMKTNFGYDAGAIDQYNNKVDSKKFLVRLDYNINDKNKLSVRYSFHNSTGDQVISNSSSSNTAGNGNRNNLPTAISPQNTGYIAGDNTRSLAIELNSSISNKFSNNLIGTFNKQIENRQYRTSVFPTVDILNSGTTYTSIGFDPFTPNNKLDYSTYNLTDNFSIYAGKHTITLGGAFEYFNSNNLFYYASNGVWVYNSIADFEAAALAYKANPNIVPGTTTSTVPIARFNYRYSLLPGGALPWQTLKAYTYSAYAQDEYQATDALKLTFGLRGDVISYASTAADYNNPVVASLTFKENGSPYYVNTSILPKSNLYLSPRFGFNYNVNGERNTQIRGGTGLFLSRIPEVLISNQLGNNGVNIGLVNVTGSAAAKYPFTTDPSIYTPATTDITKVTGYNINASDPNLKSPQVWKTNFAIDQRLPMGFVATAEFIYNKFINSLLYKDANLNDATSTITGSGADNRPRYPASGLTGAAATNAKFVNPAIGDVYMLSNVTQGYAYSATFKLERNASKGLGGMLAYTYAVAKDVATLSSTVDATTPAVNGVNYLSPSYSNNDLRNRIVGYLNYRIEYGGMFGGATQFSLGMVSASGSKISYTYGNDVNGDGQSNDLLYVPKSGSELTFAPVTGTYKDASGTTQTYTYTPAQQQAAFDAYINNNSYLSSRRGQYAERNGAQYPWLTRFDLSVQQEFYVKAGPGGNKRNTISVRADIFNFGNMLNNKWGVGWVSTGTSPLSLASISSAGVPTYKMATQTINGVPMLIQDSFLKSAALTDVWQMQLGIRYSFN